MSHHPEAIPDMLAKQQVMVMMIVMMMMMMMMMMMTMMTMMIMMIMMPTFAQEANYDIVTGSRYIRGGGVSGWDLRRKVKIYKLFTPLRFEIVQQLRQSVRVAVCDACCSSPPASPTTSPTRC